jgi:hypothetical protein
MAIGLDETLDVSVLKTPDGARTYLLQLLHAIKDHVRIWLDNNLLHRFVVFFSTAFFFFPPSLAVLADDVVYVQQRYQNGQ